MIAIKAQVLNSVYYTNDFSHMSIFDYIKNANAWKKKKSSVYCVEFIRVFSIFLFSHVINANRFFYQQQSCHLPVYEIYSFQTLYTLLCFHYTSHRASSKFSSFSPPRSSSSPVPHGLLWDSWLAWHEHEKQCLPK